MPRFVIDPDIRKAKTLPAEFYTDERFFELSKQMIFARTWQFLGRVTDSASLMPVNILPEFLDEPVLLVNSGGEFRCLSNVCTHRGKILVEEPCKASLIRCGYHGRRFSLDGKFLSMPEFEGVENFPSEADNLRQIPAGQFMEFAFASLDPSVQFDDVFTDVGVKLEDIETDGLELVSTREYEVAAHWALYC